MKAYAIFIKNTASGQRLQKQFLDGYLVTSLSEANQQAETWARKESLRTRASWIPIVTEYTVGHKPG